MRRQVFATAVTALALLVGSAGGASAAGPTKTDWTPTGPNDPEDVQACGTTITLSDVKNAVQTRTITYRDGTVRTEFRGKEITQVTAPSGKKVVLNNSGPYSITVLPNGTELDKIHAPGLIYYFNDTEKKAFQRAGLPPVFYMTGGRLDLRITDDGEKVLKRPKKGQVKDVCTLLKRA